MYNSHIGDKGPNNANVPLVVQAPAKNEYNHDSYDNNGFGRNIKKLLATGVLAVTVVVGCGSPNNNEADRRETSQETIDPSMLENTEQCPSTYEVVGVDHGERNRWFADGIPSIREAKNSDEARDAIGDWLHGNNEHLGIKHDAKLFAAAYNILIGEDIKPQDLIDENGCATEEMLTSLAKLEIKLSDANVQPGVAPANGYNTGTDKNGNVTVSSERGVYGNDESRKAIMVVLPGGKENIVYILARCGQPVVSKQPGNIRPGPTEREETPQTTTTTIPPKVDDGRVPGNHDEPGVPDRPGSGPSGQLPNSAGYLPGEEQPTNPTTTSDTVGSTTTTSTRPNSSGTPPTTGSPPPTTNPPVPVSTTTSTSTPPNTMPPKP